MVVEVVVVVVVVVLVVVVVFAFVVVFTFVVSILSVIDGILSFSISLCEGLVGVSVFGTSFISSVEDCS